MSIEPRDLLLKIKEAEFVYDTGIGKTLNGNHEEDKQYVINILDLLYKNFERVRYIDDMSESKIGKGKWAVMISEKFAMMDKRIPIPQVPFNIKIAGKNDLSMKPKHAYLMLIGFFQVMNEEICVYLNFKNNEYRNAYKELINKVNIH